MQILNDGKDSNQMTFVGKMSLVGKVGYAPREQISLGLCSPCSDLYALGVTTIVLLTGRDPSLLMDQYSLEWKWRSYSYVSDAFAQVLDRMLADTPNKRYQTAKEVLTDLKLLGEQKVEAPTTMVHLSPTVFISESQTMATTAQSYNQSGETIFSLPPRSEVNQSEQQPLLNPAFIKRCQQALAYYIGPMANLVIEETLAQNPQISPYQFVEIIAKEIPDFQAVFEFKKTLFS